MLGRSPGGPRCHGPTRRNPPGAIAPRWQLSPALLESRSNFTKSRSRGSEATRLVLVQQAIKKILAYKTAIVRYRSRQRIVRSQENDKINLADLYGGAIPQYPDRLAAYASVQLRLPSWSIQLPRGVA